MGNIERFFIKHWKNILIVALAIVLLAIFFRSCEKGNTHKQELAEVKKQMDSVALREKASNAKVDALNRKVDSLNQEKNVVKGKLEVVSKQLDESQTVATRLARRIKSESFRLAPDTTTTWAWRDCDSLADVVIAQQGVIDSNQEYEQQLGTLYEAQLSAKDSIIAEREKLYKELRTSFDKVSASYLNIYKDYNFEVSKRKKSRTLNRILAGAVIVLGGTTILK